MRTKIRFGCYGILLWLLPAMAQAELAAGQAARGDAVVSTAQTTSAERAQPAVGVVNINTATEQELELLPGIGPARAKAIVQLRQKIGTFRALTDVIRVRGIGPATYRRLKPMMTLQGATTLQGSVAHK
jgi:competence protein ComEA